MVQKPYPQDPASSFVTLELVTMTARQVPGAKAGEEESLKGEFQGPELDYRGKLSRIADQVEKADRR